MQPNIILFVTDDHGAWALPESDPCLTAPSLNYLMSVGTEFTNTLCTSPVCSPARASLLTGRYPSYHGVHDYIDEQGPGAHHAGIAELTNLGDRAQRHGYQTGLFGKWHCGNFLSPYHGFDRWFTLRDGTNARFGRQRFVDQDAVVDRHGYQSPYVTQAALDFLSSADSDSPRFAIISYTDTHTPHDNAPPRLVQAASALRGTTGSSAIGPAAPAAFEHAIRFAWAADPQLQTAQIDDYRASVEMVDAQVGRVLDHCAGLPSDRPTVFIYTSDHGHMNGHFGLHTKGNATVPQNLLDPSLRVPLIVWDPAAPPSVQTAPVTHMDLHEALVAYFAGEAGANTGDASPTVAASAVDHQASRDNERSDTPGRSLRPLIGGHLADSGWQSVRFAEYGNARMVQNSEWKLIARYRGPNGHFADELYRVDATGTPDEHANLATSSNHASVVLRLREQLNTHFARHTRPEHDGSRPERFQPHNPWEPWRLDPANPTTPVTPPHSN